VKNGLIADADEIFAKTHKSFMKLDIIRIALITVICDNEPKECDFWRSYQKDAEKWEDTVKRGPHPAAPKEGTARGDKESTKNRVLARAKKFIGLA